MAHCGQLGPTDGRHGSLDPQHGQPQPDDTAILPRQGYQQQAHPMGYPPSRYFCHLCGNALSDGAQFCAHCGTPRQTVVDPGSGMATRSSIDSSFGWEHHPDDSDYYCETIFRRTCITKIGAGCVHETDLIGFVLTVTRKATTRSRMGSSPLASNRPCQPRTRCSSSSLPRFANSHRAAPSRGALRRAGAARAQATRAMNDVIGWNRCRGSRTNPTR